MSSDVRALCRSYAAHAGLPEPEGGFEKEAARRLSLWPLWARLGARMTASAVRWLAPLLLLARPSSFDALAPDEKDAVLERLQQARLPAARGAFLMIKTIVLGTCYGNRPS